MKFKVSTLIAVIGIFVVAGFSVLSSGTQPASKAFSLDAIRARSLFTSQDPLASRLSLLDSAVREFAEMKGQFASPSDMAQEGWLPFVMSSAYARRPIRNTCNGPSAGDYCFALNSPYDIAAFKVYDSSASPISNVFWENTTIDPEDRDRPRTLVYQAASASGLSLTDQQLVFAGQLLGSHLLSIISSQGTSNAVPDAFNSEPYNQWKDPVTGELLTFDGSAYGSRVTFSDIRGGTRIRMQITGSSGGIVYEADFGSLSEAGQNGAFRILRSPLLPGMTPTEDLPPVFPWQDGGAAACASSSALASAPAPQSPASLLTDSFFPIFSSRAAIADDSCPDCLYENCCGLEPQPPCIECKGDQCCDVSYLLGGCGCPANACCLYHVCGIITFTTCSGEAE